MSETERVTIERLAAEGDGVGRLADGRVVFVPATAPGDVALVRIVEEQPRFARAELVSVLQPGASRVEPRCPLVGVCGGCAWQHIAYTDQCSAKARRVADTFERVAKLALPGPVECTPCPAPYGYRSRARLGFRDGVVGFRRTRSHQLCGASACPVLVPALDAALARLSDDPPAGNGELTLAAGDDGSVCVTGDGRAGIPIGIDAPPAAARIRISPGVFFQANSALRQTLAEAVHTLAGTGARALELFAGSGFFTLGLAARFDRVLVVESQGLATRDLAENLARSGHANVEVLTGLAERTLEAPTVTGFSPDVVVLDPPRKGLDRVAADRIAMLGAPRIVYVACDPATQARDAARIAGHGYRLTRLRAYDLFPQTPHVESIALLERDARG